MINRTHIPRPPLSNFIDLFWSYEGYYQSHDKERVLPDGSVELVINLAEDQINVYDSEDPDQFQRHRGSLISGPHSGFSVIDTASQTSVIGVHFKPGGAFPFLGFPARELHNQVVSSDEIWGIAALDLRDQLLEAETPEARFLILEKFLLTRAGDSLALHPAVAFALQHFQGVSQTQKISDVTGELGLSSRRFIQVFREQVGMTPKVFCRIVRFQEVLRLIGKRQNVDWTDIALACGYYDQAHFIHDFRAFSGLNPKAYLSLQGEHQNHVPLQD